jgi:hypothetical protein
VPSAAAAPLTPLDAAILANQGALAAGVRRSALAQIGAQAASLTFASYDDAIALRAKMDTAFSAEISIAGARRARRRRAIDADGPARSGFECRDGGGREQGQAGALQGTRPAAESLSRSTLVSRR